MVTTIASRNSYSERRFLKRDWQIISYRICTMNCSISPLWLSANDDVSITSPPITGIFGVISYSYASKAKVGYANAKAVV